MIPRRFPLLAKIVCWLFLNVGLLVLVGWIVVQQQLRLGFDSLFAGRAGDRIRSVADLVVRELNDAPASEWTGILAKFDGSYPVSFHLFAHDGKEMAGRPITLPAEIVARLPQLPLPGRGAPLPRGDRRPPPPRREDDPFGGPPGPPGPPEAEFDLGNAQLDQMPPPHPGTHAPELAGFFHAGSPKRYWLLVRAPLSQPPPGGPFTLVLVSTTLGAGGLFFDLSPFLFSGVAALILSVFFWLPLIRGITYSIARLRDATVSIADGRFDVRVDDRRRDELGTLGAAINTMSERLAGLVTGQKRFLSDVAHELCAPLSRLQMALSILEARAGEEDRERFLDLREEVDQMASLVNELLSFSRAALGPQKVQLLAVNLRDCLEKAIHREASVSTQIALECEPDLAVYGNGDLLLRAFGNLLRNAIRYAGDAGPISFSAKVHGSEVQIDIVDSGPGVPAESLGQLFDPFYRVDTSRTRETGGVGLGLTIAQTCVTTCGGTITASNVYPHGLRVNVRLQKAETAEPLPPPQEIAHLPVSSAD